ncbi:MAG: hypothetical protein KC416_12465 [Myxococcales bacterium]|nr:hypothetical protein [Myxococcales bacterium]
MGMRIGMLLGVGLLLAACQAEEPNQATATFTPSVYQPDASPMTTNRPKSETANRVEKYEYGELALDSESNPHLAYRSITGQAIYAARGLNGNGKYQWVSETIDWRGDTGHGLKIDFDSDNQPHVCYATAVDGGGYDHFYIHRTGSNAWSVPLKFAGKGPECAIAVDGGNIVHLLFEAKDNPAMPDAGGIVYYKSKKPRPGAVDWIAAGYGAPDPEELAIRVDSGGTVHIAFEGINSTQKATLYYVTRTGDVFSETPEQIDPIIGDGLSDLALLIGPELKPHFAYARFKGSNSSGTAYYVVRAAPGDPKVSAVNVAVGEGELDVALDPTGSAHMAVALGQDGLALHRRVAGDWAKVELPASFEGEALNVAVAADGDGKSHVFIAERDEQYVVFDEDGKLVAGAN